ncbi:MAG: vanadium-dependent haloperoxidase [Myxococcota bacterium]
MFGNRGALAILAFGVLAGCSEDEIPDLDREFRVLASGFPGAALAVDGTAADDVWVVGAANSSVGVGPLLTHFDGTEWTDLDFDPAVNLWWVDAVSRDLVFAAGTRGTIVTIRNAETIERMTTPGGANHVVFGVWARSADEAYAVGEAKANREGFVWKWDGQSWRDLVLPESLMTPSLGHAPPLLKVWGNDEGTWVVGSFGTVLRSTDGETFEVVEIVDPDSERGDRLQDRLFTVHGSDEEVAIVGGGGSGFVFSQDADGNFVRALESPLLQGVYFGAEGRVVAVGERGLIYERQGGEWNRRESNLTETIESLHAVWIDPEGGTWAVGGNVLGPGLDEGVVVFAGTDAEQIPAPEIPQPPPPDCPAEQVQPEPDRSIARQWIEHLLNAVRRDIPEPTVHARNMYHLSAAMYDIWAAFDDEAAQLFIDERPPMPADLDAYLDTAISFAAYRLLTHRYTPAEGGEVSTDCFDRYMDARGFDISDTSVEGDGPVAFGNRVAAVLIGEGQNDGSNEAGDYAAPPGDYESLNPILVVAQAGAVRSFEADQLNPAVWQRLELPEQRTQNELILESNLQEYIGPHWRDVTPFALVRPGPGQTYFDGGEGPGFGPSLIGTITELIEKEALLDLDLGIMIDVSPGGYGNNSLGLNDGTGYDTNPVTGQPYQPVMVNQADFGRLMAEYWADGPNSETPPGHWNSIAHFVTDDPNFEPLFEGTETLGRLEYDVKLHLALNGALHDAAITAWELKREYETSRPITLIRHMAELGQSTEASAADYDPAGLPLVDGLIERITPESVAPGERHFHLRPYVGEIAVRGWLGEPSDATSEVGGIDWIRALDWVPYQARTFVSPAFPGYTSGHSTFSRAAAEVLALFTGSPWFPNGVQEFFIGQNEFLKFEEGPSADVRLQFASYYDAADQAGQSRIWGGIHIEADDFVGRTTGSAAGIGAFERAKALFEGNR